MNAHVWVSPTKVTHAVTSFGPRTLCGVPLAAGWGQENEIRHADDSTVECRKCRKALSSSEGA